MTIALICLAITCWIACALITAGVTLHFEPDLWEGSEELLVFIFLIGWWLFALINCGALILKLLAKILKQLVKVMLFIVGFLDAVTRKDDQK